MKKIVLLTVVIGFCSLNAAQPPPPGRGRGRGKKKKVTLAAPMEDESPGAQAGPVDLPLLLKRPKLPTLHQAASANKVKEIRQLLENKKNPVDPNEQDPIDGSTAAHVAAKFGYLKVLQTLLDCPGTKTDIGDAQGQTVLHVVVEYDFVAVAQYLLGHPHKKPNPNAVDVQGDTPLFFVRSEAMALLLLKAGANPTWTSFTTLQTPLDLIKGTMLPERDAIVAAMERSQMAKSAPSAEEVKKDFKKRVRSEKKRSKEAAEEPAQASCSICGDSFDDACNKAHYPFGCCDGFHKPCMDNLINTHGYTQCPCCSSKLTKRLSPTRKKELNAAQQAEMDRDEALAVQIALQWQEELAELSDDLDDAVM